jgi:uncharacterized protein (TIGR00251 family)
MLSIQHHPAGLTFKICVQPRSSRNMVVGLLGDALKVKLTAPPVEGAANTMCIEFLARCLGVPRSSVEIRAGQTARIKQILIRCDPADKPRLLQCIVGLAPDESS